MTDVNTSRTGAPITDRKRWDSINWKQAEKSVHRLQMRIAKAFREKQYGKVKSLQWLLTHSYYSKCLAVKRVTQNRGSKTPGVDGEIWKSPTSKMKAVQALRRRGYKPMTLKRVYIPKRNQKESRPLSIPVMRCRAMQALYLLALEPISEMMADIHSYGFRPGRSAHDAITKCHRMLAKRGSAKYVLEVDIKSCFSSISHSWLLKHIPMDKKMLANWLQAGYMEEGKIHPTLQGTPQGGIISATLLVVTLSGLQEAVQSVIRHSEKNQVHFSIYADDFVITGATAKLLEERVKPLVAAFLNERGLSLSEEKTKITHISDGFDFLGVNMRKYRNGKLINKPAKASIKAFLSDINQTVKSMRTARTESLIRVLNPKIRGWCGYYRIVCAKRTFQYVDHKIFKILWLWARRRHPRKSKSWVKAKYFPRTKTREWSFSTKVKTSDGVVKLLPLYEASNTKIRRQIGLISKARAYDPAYTDYFKRRAERSTIAA